MMNDDASTRTDNISTHTPAPVDDLVTRDHQLNNPEGTLHYRSSTGRLVVSAESVEEGRYQGNKAQAQVFITAYTRTDASGQSDPSRPVVFAFNGGPGSSSIWLHLGLFGPRRVVPNDVEQRSRPPYGLLDNPQTLLAEADLVFIDPMTTGYTRAVTGEQADQHHGFTADRDLVAETIRLWLTRNNRWLSPKFLAGESYGTTRAAALAGYLGQRYGIALNGVILISTVLDFGTIMFSEGNEAPYVHFLPTFAAIAHFHGKHPQREVGEVYAEAEEFATGEYATALARGHRLSAESRQVIAARLAQLTGISEQVILENDLRITDQLFFGELLRDQRLRVGRLDARFTGFAANPPEGSLVDDPSYPIIQYPYTAAFNHYVREELGYHQDLLYEVISPRVHPWSYQEFENRSVTTAEDLASAMRANPDLYVYIGYGYHDAATPISASEYVLAHLRIPSELLGNIRRFYYPAGHMMYVHQPSRIQQSRDIAEFLHAALAGQG